MKETFHIRCDFCHIEFDSWQNAPYEYREHIAKCLEVDDKTADKILKKVLPEQFYKWASIESTKIKNGDFYG